MGKPTLSRVRRYLSTKRLSRKKIHVEIRKQKQVTNDTGTALQCDLQEYGKDSGSIDPNIPVLDLDTSQQVTQEINQQRLQEEAVNDPKENGASLEDGGMQVDAVLVGRCIADIPYILEQLCSRFDSHNPSANCPFRDLKLLKSQRIGLKIQFFLRCQQCNTEIIIHTDREDDNKMDVNRCAVSGTIATGIGYSQMEELLAAMDIPCMAAATYRKYNFQICKAFEKAATAEIEKAAEESRTLAIEKGDYIIHDNVKIPFIAVVADCSWMKRSYRTGRYDSLSGVGAILDYRTGKVLYRGVRNKFCAVCEWATRHGKEPNVHVCFKNWGRDQASTGMESDAIVEGFKTSVRINGLIYKTLIADGDSSVYKAILDTHPYEKYEVVVDKRECVNHLLRNLSGKIKKIAETPGRTISQQKKVVLNSVKRFMNAIKMSVTHRQNGVTETAVVNNASTNSLENESTDQNGQTALLKKDILNVPYHVFGDHRSCKQLNGICNGDPAAGEQNLVDVLKKAGLFDQLETLFTYFSFHASNLMYDATNNIAEAYNSIVCKFIGGKRINFGMRFSYQTRCDGSVLQHNTQNVLTKLHQSENKEPPRTVMILETRRKRQIHLNAQIKKKRNASRDCHPTRQIRGTDKNYGPNAQRPDLPQDLFDELVELHRGRLLEKQKNRVEVEKQTRLQAENEVWRSMRQKMLTASNFGKVCRMRNTTSSSSTVQSMLFPSVQSTPAMLWGRANEATAVRALEKKLSNEGNPVEIKRCGLFIDSELEYLGASPDGIIENNGIVEIKCPRSAQKYSPTEAIQLNVSEIPKFFDRNDNTKMNTAHQYYYQVQGQLHITQRLYCYFAVWTPLGLKYVTVLRDDYFWKSRMEQQLKRFYNHCLLPEIIDSRYIRKMTIRDPEYILVAQQVVLKRKRSGVISDSEMHERWTNVSTECTSRKDDTSDARPRIMPVTLIRSSESEDDWMVSRSDETSEATDGELRVPPITLSRQGSANDIIHWRVSSAEEPPSSTDELSRVPRNATWVTIRDNDESYSPTRTEVEILDSINKNVPITVIKADILMRNSLLNDTSIDNFLDVVGSSSHFEPRTSLWLAHRQHIQPLSAEQDIQIIGGNEFRHWRCIYFDGVNLNVHDSLFCGKYDSLKEEEKRYLTLRYPNLSTKDVVFRKVQKQIDSYSCGVFAAAFATTVALGGNPSTATYSKAVMKLRRHLLGIIQSKTLSAFPSM